MSRSLSLPNHDAPELPPAPRAIQKGVPVKEVLNVRAAAYLARNISLVDPGFDPDRFLASVALSDDMTLMARGKHLGEQLFTALDRPFSECIAVMLKSLTPVQASTEEFGLAGMFYLPHSFLISLYGIDPAFNKGLDPFATSMAAQHALTQRFTAEFCIRDFLIQREVATLAQLKTWLNDPSPHVRRLVSEGSRPRLPWGKRLPAFDKDPSPILPLLEALRDDPVLYVRRSVANSLGDIGKNNLDVLLEVCEAWLEGASAERRWLIRHALRHPDKKGVSAANELRARAR